MYYYNNYFLKFNKYHSEPDRHKHTCSAAVSLLWQGGGEGGRVRKRRECSRGGQVSVEEVVVWVIL